MQRLPGARFQASPNRTPGRSVAPELLIIHYTAGGAASGSIRWLCDPAAKASAHLVIDRDGTVTQLVDFGDRAWHAGGSSSSWNGRTVNERSIGIELANYGPLYQERGVWFAEATKKPITCPVVTDASGKAWEGYPEAQLAALERVLAELVRAFPVLATPSPGALPRITGHQNVDPSRKRDPGPAFPWSRFRVTP
jgi:N-acetylmuramoyl-L-alanine amidase